MKTDKIKKKVAAKVAKGKAKVAAKCGKAAKACAALALLAALTGCHMGEQPTAQRAQNSVIRDTVFNITFVMPTNTTVVNAEGPAIHVEVGNQAQANETSGTETMTASPSNTPTVSTPVRVDARYNDAMAAANGVSKNVLGLLDDASKEAVLKLMDAKESGTVEVTKKDGTKATVKCEGGQCSECTDGACADKD